MIEDAIKAKKDVAHGENLKGKDEKSERMIKPKFMGEKEYAGRSFLGLEAMCSPSREERVFNVERI